MVVLVVGDFDPAEALSEIEKQYADFAPGHDPIPIPQEPVQTEQRWVEVAFDGETEPLVYVSFKSPAFDPHNKLVLAGPLLAEFAAGCFSPLYQDLVLDQQRATGIWTWFEHHRDPSLWGFSLRVKKFADVASIENEVSAAIAQLRANPVEHSRLDAVRSYVRNRFIRNLSSPTDVASVLARVIALNGDVGDVEKIYTALEALTPADIQQAAKQWLRKETSTVAVLHAADEQAPSQRTSEINTLALAPSNDPIVSISMWIKAGSQNNPPGKEGLAAITSSMLAWAGSEQYSLAELDSLRRPLGARFSWIVDKEMTTLTWSVPRDSLDGSYGLFIGSVLQPGFLLDDFERIREGNLSRISKRFVNDSDEELAQFALSGEVFRGTPYEHHIQGTVESLPKLTIDDIKQFYANLYTRDNVTFGVSGNYPDTLIERLRSDFARLGGGGERPLISLNLQPIEGRRVVLIGKPNAPTSISFGAPISVTRASREYYALYIANAWLGQHRKGFGRLFDVIRRQRGLNYGNYSYIEAFKWCSSRVLPPNGLGRRQQMFEVWLRSLATRVCGFCVTCGIARNRSVAT